MSDRLALAVSELIEALREEARTEAAAVPRALDRLLSIDEAATTLGIGRTATYSELSAGRLRSIRVGRRRLVVAGAIAAYIADRQVGR